MNIQEKLNAAYRPLVDLNLVYERLGECRDADEILKQLNGPFLLATNDVYESAIPRIIIVGQENNGWIEHYDYRAWFNSMTVDETVAAYRRFDVASYPYGSFSRYFAMFRDELLEPAWKGNPKAVLWGNLFKLNHQGSQSIYSPLLEPMLRLQAGVIEEEITALQPDVVLFLTGPRYDDVLRRSFPDAEFQAIDGHPTNEIAKVVAANLPKQSFRTYHPGYLNRIRRKKPHCVEAIISQVRCGYR